MKPAFKTLRNLALIGVFGATLGVTSTALAIPTPTPPTKCVGDFVAVIKCLYNEAQIAIYNSLTATNPSAPQTIAGNVEQKTALEKTKENSQTLTAAATKSVLSRQGTSDTTSIQLSGMLTSGMGAVKTRTGLFGTASDKALEAQQQAGDQSLTFSTFFSPPTGTYTPEQAAAARNFIAFVSQTAKPLSTVKLSDLTPEQLQTLRRRNASAYQDYILDLRSIVAAQSVALNNLYYLYAQREPAPDNKASLLAQEETLANRRADDPKWYDDMQNATSATIQRETLFVLAEIRKQMQQNYLMQQRILATLSTMQLQNVGMAKQLLSNKEKAMTEAMKR